MNMLVLQELLKLRVDPISSPTRVKTTPPLGLLTSAPHRSARASEIAHARASAHSGHCAAGHITRAMGQIGRRRVPDPTLSVAPVFELPSLPAAHRPNRAAAPETRRYFLLCSAALCRPMPKRPQLTPGVQSQEKAGQIRS